jgi:hypothetical protein
MLVTSDMNLIPLDTTGQTDAPRIVSTTSTEYGMLLAWSTIPGRTYRVVYKTNVTDPQWTTLSGDITATGSSLYWADASAGSSAQRFYSISLLP